MENGLVDTPAAASGVEDAPPPPPKKRDPGVRAPPTSPRSSNNIPSPCNRVSGFNVLCPPPYPAPPAAAWSPWTRLCHQ